MLIKDVREATETVYRALSPQPETTSMPRLLLFSGLPGTGKSFLARKVAEQLRCVIVESDFVRKTLTRANPEYTPHESSFIHRVSHKVVEQLLLEGHTVIHDATNLAESHREQLYRIVARTHAKLVIVQTIAPVAIVQERLAQRFNHRDPLDLSDADWGVHEQLRAEQEQVRRPHLVVDTSTAIDDAVAKILRASR